MEAAPEGVAAVLVDDGLLSSSSMFESEEMQIPLSDSGVPLFDCILIRRLPPYLT